MSTRRAALLSFLAMAGTAGNLSAKDEDNNFWITASGCPKGRLQETDFLLINVEDGTVIERTGSQDKPSAETAIHCRRDPVISRSCGA